jgi:spectinomycin phosphotransferase
MRSRPADLDDEDLARVVARGWGLRVASLAYVPEGGGSHHWRLADGDGRAWFVTVDDLGVKDWLGGSRDAVFGGLGQALATAAALRGTAGLEFVLAPVPGRDGALLRRLGDRYGVSVFPFLAGSSWPFGPYPDDRLRGEALDVIAALHRATPAVTDVAPRHTLGAVGRAGLDAFLRDPGRPWEGGPFAAAAHDLLLGHATDLGRLAASFDLLARRTAAVRAAGPVITHGEPHPANLLSAGGRLLLIDWDTVGLAPPERDLALILGENGEGADRYQKAAGRAPDPAVLTLYQARWYLDDLASAVQLFRQPHTRTADTQRWWENLPPQLAQLPIWLGRLG